MMLMMLSTEVDTSITSGAGNPTSTPQGHLHQDAQTQSASAARMMQIRASASPFLRYMEELEDLILNAASVPLTHFTLVNSEHVIPLMDNIRESLPQEILQSQRILDVRDQMLQEASEQAARTIEQAQQQARMIVSESELLRAVYQEAEGLRQQVITETEHLRQALYQEANALRQQSLQEAGVVRGEVEHYVNQVLHSLDETFNQYHAILSNTQTQLSHIRPLFTSPAMASSPQPTGQSTLAPTEVELSHTEGPSRAVPILQDPTPYQSALYPQASPPTVLPQAAVTHHTELSSTNLEPTLTQEGLTPSGLPPYHVIQQALKENPHIPPKKVLEVLLQTYQTHQTEHHKRSALETILAKDKVFLPHAGQAATHLPVGSPQPPYTGNPLLHGQSNNPSTKLVSPKHKVSAKSVAQKQQKLSPQYR
ncbi:MAG: hypothetical protein ACKO37_02030 [Vampirovibrionales bacterium]